MADPGQVIPATPPEPRRIKPWVYLAVSAVLSAIPWLFLLFGGATAVYDLFMGIYDRFALLQPFSVIPLYFERLTECEYHAEIDYTNCSAWRLINPARWFVSLFATAGSVLQQSDGLAVIVLIFALAVGYAVALKLVKKLTNADEADLLTVTFAAAATPFVASIVALICQGVAMLLSFVLAYTAFVAAATYKLLEKGWHLYKGAKEVTERAQTLEELHAKASTLFNKTPPKV